MSLELPKGVIEFTLSSHNEPLAVGPVLEAHRKLVEAIDAQAHPVIQHAISRQIIPDLAPARAKEMLSVVGSRAGRGAVALYAHDIGDESLANVVCSDTGGYLLAGLAENRCVAQAEQWALGAGRRFLSSGSAALGIANFGTLDRMSQFLSTEADEVQLMGSRTAGALTAALLVKDTGEEKPLGLRLMEDHAEIYMQTEHASLGVGTLGSNLRAYTTMVDLMEEHIEALAGHRGVVLPVTTGLSTPLTRDRVIEIITDTRVSKKLRESGAAEEINKYLRRHVGTSAAQL